MTGQGRGLESSGVAVEASVNILQFRKRVVDHILGPIRDKSGHETPADAKMLQAFKALVRQSRPRRESSANGKLASQPRPTRILPSRRNGRSAHRRDAPTPSCVRTGLWADRVE